MSTHAVINIKIDPVIKSRAARVAEKLGVSINAVLSNELRRFAAEESVTFDMPSVPNAGTRRTLVRSRALIDTEDYHRFQSNQQSIDFLRAELQ